MTAPEHRDEFWVENPRNPQANVRHFLRYVYGGDDIRWKLAYHRGSFYEWVLKKWRPLDKDTLESLVYTTFEEALYPDGEGNPQSYPCTPGNMEAMLRGLRNTTLIDRDVNVPAWLEGNREIQPKIDPPLPSREVIACENVILHAPTRRIFGRTPQLFNMTAVNYEYQVDAKVPDKWLRFLNEIWPDDHESIDTLQEWFGYCLTSRTDLQKMLMFLGPPRSGKGTIVRVLTALLGGETSVTSISLADLNQRFGLEHLENKQVGIMQDARFRSRDDGVAVERLLSITGEDEVSIDKKGKGIYAAKLSTRFMLISNEIPSFQDESGALKTRLLALKTFRSISVENRDSSLTDRLIEELPGILNWALDGLDRLNRREFFQQPKSALGDLQAMAYQSSPMQSFFDENLIEDYASEVPVKDVYAVYQTWCSRNGLRAKGRPQFSASLRSLVSRLEDSHPRIDGKQVHHYVGIRLTDSAAEMSGEQAFLDAL